MNTLISAMRTSAIIASTIIVIVALIATTWIAGVKLAEPFGIILFNMIVGLGNALDDQEASDAQQEKAVKISQQENRKKLERLLSGAVASFLVFCTVVYEHALAGVGVYYIGLWDYCVLVLKGIFEALFALGMLRLAFAGVRRLVSN
jgi:hypothetical protein